MFRTQLRVVTLFAALLAQGGCGRGGSPQVEVVPQGSLDQARAILIDYTKGAPMGSEAMTFEEIVQDVRKTDPKKAEALEKGFADLKAAAPDKRGAKARELLKQL